LFNKFLKIKIQIKKDRNKKINRYIINSEVQQGDADVPAANGLWRQGLLERPTTHLPGSGL
jgi:hypothetical protein